MGVGDLAVPVASDVEVNNPVPKAEIDEQKAINERLRVQERSGNAELVRQIRWLYENLPGGPYTYPPP